jgi:hypothetical protein
LSHAKELQACGAQAVAILPSGVQEGSVCRKEVDVGAKSKGSDFWKKQIELVAISGLGPTVYCRKHGLEPSVFYRWRRQLAADSKKAKRKSARLIPVEVIDARPKSLGASFRLELPRLGVVEISGDAGAVTKVIQMLHWEVV